MSKLTLLLPYPDAGLSPNARLHFKQKAKLTRDARTDGWAIARVALPPEYVAGNIPMRLTFCPPDKRGRDLDNAFASCKPALDGIAEAMHVNDKQFHPVTLDWGESEKPGRVIVEIDTP